MVEYRCPGEAYPISRSIHLGRLAQYYPGCRQCPHRDDVGTLSRRQVQQLVETRPRGLSPLLFHSEGVGGVLGHDLRPDVARDMAAALGVSLRREMGADHTSAARPPVTVIANDGRPLSCELVAAVGEGLRWAGCQVVDVGPASAACVAFAIDHLRTAGGILVGNPTGLPHTVGLKFWGRNARPLSSGGSLELLGQTYAAGVDRPGRRYGSLRRFRADVPYLAAMVEHYHALRPLRFVLDCSCSPFYRYLKELAEPLACRIVPHRTSPDRMPDVVSAEAAHFAVRIADDGETCHLFDEQGRSVPTERLLLLLARHLLEIDPHRAVVLEEETAPSISGKIEKLTGRAATGGTRRAEMQQAMCEHEAVFGGGPSGRFWYTADGPPLPDALRTLTLLLVVLSRSDRHLSEVLDREAAVPSEGFRPRLVSSELC